MNKLISIGNNVKLRQGLAINKNSNHLISNIESEEFCIPLLRIADMMKKEFSTYISSKVPQSVLANKEDIIYTRTGQIGLVFNSFCGCVHNNSFIIELKSDLFDKEFFVVALTSEFVKKQALNKAMSSVQPDLTHDMFKQIMIPYFDKDIQKKIARLFNLIDSKIENNNKIIAELESMAKTIYNYWFLQFDFPDEKGKPYKSSGGKMVYNEELKREIPKGWEVETLGSQILENIKSTIQVGNAKDGSGIIPFFTSGDSIKHINDVIVKGLNIFLSTGGNAKVQYYFGDASYSTDTWCIKGKENFSEYLYYYLKNIETQMDKLYFHGTGLKHLQKPVFKKSFLYVPTKETLKSFSKIVKYNMIKTSQLLKENQELASLRDFLLPMLMNGQVTFKS